MSSMVIDAEFVLTINHQILVESYGLKGAPDMNRLIGALMRVDNHILYAGLENIFDIAALYGVAIAKAHAFLDGNKRTALVVVTSYLESQGISLEEDTNKDDVMVAIADGSIGVEEFSEYLKSIAMIINE